MDCTRKISDDLALHLFEIRGLFLRRELPHETLAGLGLLPFFCAADWAGYLLCLPQLSNKIGEDICLVILLHIPSVQIVCRRPVLPGRLRTIDLLPLQPGHIAGPLHPLKHLTLIQIPHPIIIELDLKLILHQLIDILHLMKCEPLEHPKPLSIVKDVESGEATQHIHGFYFAGVDAVVGVLVEGV